MSPDLTRAQRRFLGLSAAPTLRTDAELAPLTCVVLHRDARTTLRDVLYTAGDPVGGPLYGHADQGTLHVRLVAPAGYRWWLPPNDPLQLDPRYTLGWGDAVQALSSGRLHWVGQWLALPLRQLPSADERRFWLERARQVGLVDRETPLLLAGWKEELLDAVAALSLSEGEEQLLEVQVHPQMESGMG